MSLTTLFSGIFCNDEAVSHEVVAKTGHHLITDNMVIETASELSGIPKNKIKKSFSAETSIFNQFTHEKERSIAYLKLSLARIMEQENLLISGNTGLLIPRDIDHVLRVCLVANTEFRLSLAKKESQFSRQDAAKVIRLQDQDRGAWTKMLFSVEDPWDTSLYDIMLPMDKTGVTSAGTLIIENMTNEAIKPTVSSTIAQDNFLLASTIEVALINSGHNVAVTADQGNILLTVNKQVLMLNRLEEELKDITAGIPGVKSIEVSLTSPDTSHEIYWKQNREMPSKVLLVDDEREFVQTLSERLQIRDMGSAIAFDGQSALDMVQKDEPEVMIIDLKMPGIDGIEVLRKVKKTQPEIEVIVLTGHGSEQDRKTCLDLGAFAYMQKPVDIALLSETLKKAHEKIRSTS